MLLFRSSLPNLKSDIRFIHAVPNAPNVDIYSDGTMLHQNLAFGQVTKYITLPTGKHDIQLFKAYTKESPIISKSIELLPNTSTTANVVLENDNINFLTIDDTECDCDYNSFLSYVRFINLSPDSSMLSLSLPNGPVLFNEASYLETNNYYPVSPGIYNFVVSSSINNFSKFINMINLKNDMFITIYIVGMMNDSPKIGYILVKDNINKKDKILLV
ncbi:DUF4397 domain-containing protein [Clostridium weizhouense]|uniref:DUF4397 domain-containing protein n=1 Tax=Clostridium weizhouense TaxID=2859781 RepID=A0ABS7AIZ9_9CLOT|nr:DUF4397 domain-containing protein [Clostridium weizhouense]MBW6408632.1 DUF4397 domain-containing protein [Clostridium weizhouense]